MALYTTLGAADFARVADAFGLGEVLAVEGIPEGSINTNHRVTFSRGGRLFVRHTTVRSAQDLTFEADLLRHLAATHFPAPVLVRTGRDEPFIEVAGGRVSVFHWLVGEELKRSQLTYPHVESVGSELGKMHRLTGSFVGERDNPYGPALVDSWVKGLEAHPSAEIAGYGRELAAALARALRSREGLEPRGVIHADLFLDNVKWIGDRVGAFFDFEMACRDDYGLDLAITLNAWCFDGGYDEALVRALLRGYQQERSLSQVERDNLYGHALYGAVRYTASRIRDFHLSDLPPEKLTPKNFRTYLARLRTLERLGPVGFRALTGL